MSLPASGSVTANEKCISPRAAAGRKRRFKSSLPCTTTGIRPKIERCTALAAFIAPACAASLITSAAAVLRDRDAEIAGLGERAIELVRELVTRIVIAPVGIGKALAQGAHSGHDLALRRR